MPFSNDKKTFLEKFDKSKKGSVDEGIKCLVDAINADENYYTTSSCSGRVVLWQGSGRKNETEWIKVSHEEIDENFFQLDGEMFKEKLIWLRVEPMIMHIACRDLEAGNELLEKAKKIFKKSCFLSIQNKIIVEIRGSEFMEMPLFDDGRNLFDGEWGLLAGLVNDKMRNIFEKTRKFEKEIRN